MFSRILTSFGAVAASVGLLLWGMGKSYQPIDDDLRVGGLVLMLVSLVLLVIGILWYRRDEAALTAQIEAERRNRSS